VGLIAKPAKLAGIAAHVRGVFVPANRPGASPKVGDELSLQRLLMCSATFLNCQSYPGSIDICSGHSGAPSFLLRARLGKEEFGQANFDPDILPEPAGRLEIVKHVAGYGKILSERDLKLEMAPQEVVSTNRHIGLRDLEWSN
jgi:hypothetical protein